MKAFRKLRSDNKDIRQLQDAVSAVFRDLDRPITFGRIIENLIITSGTTLAVEHKLDRVPRGFLVIYRSAAETVYDAGTHTTKFLYLDASGNVTVNIWVF